MGEDIYMKEVCLVGVFLLIAFVTSCSKSVKTEAISTPAYFWGQGNGLCGFTRAIDAQGKLWDESGCENGELRFNKIGQLDSKSLQQLEDEFTNLPSPTKVANCPEMSPPHRFIKRTSTDSSITWETCASNKTFYGTEGLEEPYLSIANLFLL